MSHDDLKIRFNELIATMLSDHGNGADGGLTESSRKYAIAIARSLRDDVLADCKSKAA